MIIRHLPFFAVAAEEENLQRAAARLGMTQPALSRRIQDLEGELGLRLFDRVSGRLRLTPMGEYLGREARRIVNDVNEITQTLHKQSGRGLSRLALGLNERAITLAGVTEAMKAFRQDSPGCRLTVKIMSSKQQAHALREGSIDLAILYSDPSGGFESVPVVDDDPLVAALNVGHWLSKLKSLTLSDLGEEDLIWLSQERFPLGYSYLMGVWTAHGMKPNLSTEVYSAEAALQAVAAGLGVGIIRRSMVSPNAKDIVARSVTELSEAPLPLSVAWVKRQGSSFRWRFLRLLEERKLISLAEIGERGD